MRSPTAEPLVDELGARLGEHQGREVDADERRGEGADRLAHQPGAAAEIERPLEAQLLAPRGADLAQGRRGSSRGRDKRARRRDARRNGRHNRRTAPPHSPAAWRRPLPRRRASRGRASRRARQRDRAAPSPHRRARAPSRSPAPMSASPRSFQAGAQLGASATVWRRMSQASAASPASSEALAQR